MQNNILFFQSTSIGGTDKNAGLLELLLSHIDTLQHDIFERVPLIVPNKAICIWVKDQIALRKGICANFDCAVLPDSILEGIYLENNKNVKMFNFARAKFIIYDYLCKNYIDDPELNNYIYVDGQLDRLRAYQLSVQLDKIFQEYIYLRTEEIIKLNKSKIKDWQKHIISHLLESIGTEKTFLDIYRYFSSTDLDNIKLPKQLMIFGLTSIYPSQLKIINKISTKISVYWYYLATSYEYYGDLLSDRARSKLEQKLLKKPDLNLDDLYLQDGNPLLANLGQQSREFTELLIANGIEVYNFNPEQEKKSEPLTLLEQIQDDIRSIKYRIDKNYRFGNNPEVYADPISIDKQNLIDENIYDLENLQTSIKINICHNRMREVQVLFNELAELLDKNPTIKLNEIAVVAPDIDNYAPYIAAVFDNETINSHAPYRILYNITGNRQYINHKVLETLKILLNAPYVLTVNYFMEILIQSEIQTNLGLSASDIETVRKWLYDNNIHFGYDKNDYEVLGYSDYQVSSFKQFLNNIVLGACLSGDVWNEQIPLYYSNSNEVYIPYDNIDNSQVKLCNKLIILIGLLEDLRKTFYIDSLNYRELTINEVYECLNTLNNSWLQNKDSITCFEEFLGKLLLVSKDLVITLPMLNLMIDEYINEPKCSFALNGNITCTSMCHIRNVPFKYIYVLGLNFGEYPNSYTPNSLSILANEWHLADRNYNIEDKQIFLDIILSCQKRIYFSYIGRCETDNSEIKPTPLLGLFINILGRSFVNLQKHSDENPIDIVFDYKNLIVLQALHPFYNNKQPNYSTLWSQIAKAHNLEAYTSKIWDFTQISPLKLTKKEIFYSPNIDKIVKLFLYTNVNLYSSLNIRTFDNEIELSDIENFNLTDRLIAKKVYQYFEKYIKEPVLSESESKQLQEFLIIHGILRYAHIGRTQFEYYYNLYLNYITKRGTLKAFIQLDYKINEDITLNLSDEIYIEGTKIIITDNYTSIYRSTLVDSLSNLPYSLKLKGLIIYLLWMNNASITSNNDILKIDGVIIREITTTGESQDFIIKVNHPADTLARVLKYYVRSLANPVLIHKRAIEEYAKLLRENKAYELCMNAARIKYIDGYNNFDLDKIKEDLIFNSIADNYFEHIQEINGVNDIVQIGTILSRLE